MIIVKKEKNVLIRTRQNKWIVYIIIIPILILLNFIPSVLTDYLKIPFFLDTWATMLAVFLSGPILGMVVGVLYNIFMAITFWGIGSWIWCLSSIFIAIITYFFYKKGWVNLGNPLQLILVGVIIGVTNAFLTSIITYTFNFEPYIGSMSTYQDILKLTGNVKHAIFYEHLITEVADKTVSLFIAAFTIDHLSPKLKQILKRK